MESGHPKASGALCSDCFLFVLAHCSHHLLTALTIPLSPMIRSDFSLDYTYSGLVISAFNLSYGIGQLPGGWLADRIGPRIMITLGICGVAVAGFFVGLSHSFWMMIFFLALMGVLGGGYHPAAPPLIFVEPRYRDRPWVST
jgi:MFS family permease